MTTDKSQLEGLSQKFKRFAELECHNSSPLYEKLSLEISKDEDLLKLASGSLHEPIPNLFLAAVHYLLLRGNDHTLSGFFSDIESEHDQDPYPQFRAFCLESSEAIGDILRTRLVQTNEVQRSALLLPAFQFLASQTERPLALVEIGTGAGLNLLWDRYAYDYGSGRIYGDRNSEVKLECELRGELSPTFSHELPETTFRVGLDLNPLNVNDEDDVLWLKALVWPERKKRMRLLDSAVKIAQKHPLRLLKGNALEVLPNVLQTSPTDSTVCIVSTFTLYQFSKEEREKLELLLMQEAANKELCFVFAEFVDYSLGTHPELHAVLRKGTLREDKRLAKCEPHGEWLEWLYL